MTGADTKGVILVADDTAESLTMLNEALTGEGYTVLVAMDGQQAVTIAGRMAPDLILMDAIMPNMDGFEACQTLKSNAELQDIPVIFMTGLTDSEDIVRGLKSGGVDYLTKPVQIDELMARVQVHLDNARKALSIRGALNEMGQPAFACTLHGEILWATPRATEVLASMETDLPALRTAMCGADNNGDAMVWLSRNPEKNSKCRLTLGSHALSLRMLGQPYPGEFLLSIIGEDDLFKTRELRNEFGLTEREAEVLLWLARGKSNQEIAQILSMSPRTVNKHLEPVFRKLEVENRTSAAATAFGFLSGVRLS
ncbi:MAG: DNA-binding response regulator [Oceanospirillaceae bacterium]|nr:DNA-binding response regulator [Oceanospirillaceae bacterium]MBT14283.1 DNA-binding response regulator [Oceanospirillaceae bacterium]|tara:strand:+ start:62338 stop:63270 length:933 start_codon:yes stop_codon:yes gene_type:complete